MKFSRFYKFKKKKFPQKLFTEIRYVQITHIKKENVVKLGGIDFSISHWAQIVHQRAVNSELRSDIVSHLI